MGLYFCFLGLTFYSLWSIDAKNKNYLFLFLTQFLCFAVNIVAMCRFMAILLAFVSIALSLFFSVWLEMSLIKDKQGKTAAVFAPYVLWQIFWLLWCSLFWLIDYSLKNGRWKD